MSAEPPSKAEIVAAGWIDLAVIVRMSAGLSFPMCNYNPHRSEESLSCPLVYVEKKSIISGTTTLKNQVAPFQLSPMQQRRAEKRVVHLLNRSYVACCRHRPATVFSPHCHHASVRSDPGKPNQKRPVHELFAGAFRNKSSM